MKIVTRATFPLLLLTGIAGCGKSKDETRLEALQTKVAAQLTDPSSAQFRNVKFSANKEFICGEINGKNRLGGYVGFVPFAASDDFEFIDSDGIGHTWAAQPPKGSDTTGANLRKSGCFA